MFIVFDYFLFINLVSTSEGDLCLSACLLCVWLFFSSILSPIQEVSNGKVHVYCVFDFFLFNRVSTFSWWVTWMCMFIVFDYFLFNLVSTSDCELRESACLLCIWLFSLQSCLHFSRWVTWKCMFIVCLTIFSLQSRLLFRGWVTCLLCWTIFSSILSPL